MAFLDLRLPLNVRIRKRSPRIVLIGFSMLAAMTCLLGISSEPLLAQASNPLLKQLQSLDAEDASAERATTAMKQLAAQKNLALVDVLGAMKDATPIGKNWLSGLANSVQRKSKTDSATLLRFLKDSRQDSEARYMVFEWVTTADPSARKELLASFREDPSPELRYASIADDLSREAPLENTELQKLLEVARHPEQVVDIIGRLKKLDVEVDQAKHFGFLTSWRLIGPFDNVGAKNFATEFPIERDYLQGKLKDSYDGKSGPVTWKEETTDSPEGAFDLAKIYDKEKGCIVYAYATFESDKAQDAELRLGSINANRAWFNQKLAISNEVYHASQQIDQYNAPIQLRAGKNEILLKICQNEQTEVWAQNFSFQVRISDATGKAILPKGVAK